MRARFLRGSIVAVALAAAILAPGATPAAVGCADDSVFPGGVHPGGEWRSYGHDLSNTRSQPDENVIAPGTVRSLAPAWVFSAQYSAPQDAGVIHSTPVVADGCVYLTSNTGWVFAVNADNGELVWRTLLKGASQPLVGGAIVGSPTVENGIVYVGASQPGAPYVAALDQASGSLLWQTIVEVGQPNSFIDAAPIYFRGLIFQGFAGFEGNTEVSRGGFSILDAGRVCDNRSQTTCVHPSPGGTGGRVLAHQYTVSDQEFAEGFRGASVWCTGAADPATRHLYACGGNPHSEGREAKYANSLLKIDLDPDRPTFGTIVASYKGNVDQYYRGLDKQPVCENFGDETTVLVWSLGCVMLDLDFGASPNLFRDAAGRLVVGDLQKSGVYHAVYADDMTPAWNSVVAPPCFFCNAASGAFDGRRIFTVGTPPGQLAALAIDASPRYQWVSPIPEVSHYQPVTVANGVAFVIDNLGSLNAFDAETGLLLLKRPLMQDNGGQSAADPGSQGVAVARNTVYAASGEFVVAFRPGGGGDGRPPELPGLPTPPTPAGGLTVVAGPGAVATTYLTPVVAVDADAPKLSFLNLDLAPHDVDHRGEPKLFESDVIGPGQSTPVVFNGALQAGQQYGFYCSIHPNMFGTIVAT